MRKNIYCGKDLMKIKIETDDQLNKLVNVPTMTVIIRSAFEEDGNYYPQTFLDECLYEL